MSDTLQFELHPDADQLTAFAEGLLPEPERLATMAHLADCASCREVVFLAQQAMPEPVAVPAPEPAWRRWFSPLPMAGVGAALLAGAALIAISLHTPQTATPPNQTAKVSPPPPLAPPPPHATVSPTPPAKVSAAPPVYKAMSPPALGLAPPPPPPGAAMGALSAGAANVNGNPAPVRLGSPELKLPKPVPASPINIGGGMQGMPPSATGQAAKAPTMAAAPPASTTTLRAMHGVAGGTGSAAAAPVAAAAPAAPARPSSMQDTITVASAADMQTEAASSTINAGQIENLPIESRNDTTMTVVVSTRALPSKLPAVTSATCGKMTVSIDTAGTVFRSTNNGKHWKQIKQQWQGKPVTLRAATSAIAVGDESSIKIDERARTPAANFTLTTDSGVLWTSADGEHWQRH